MPVDPAWVISGLLAIIGAVLGWSIRVVLQNLERQHREAMAQIQGLAGEFHTLNGLFMEHVRDHATGAFQPRE